MKWILYVVFAIVTMGIWFYIGSNLGWRHAGIKELRALEDRVTKLEIKTGKPEDAVYLPPGKFSINSKIHTDASTIVGGGSEALRKKFTPANQTSLKRHTKKLKTKNSSEPVARNRNEDAEF